MKVELLSIPCAFFEMNSYLLHEESSGESCILVDAGLDAEPILEELERRKWRPEVILLTHGHADHLCGVPVIREAFPDVKIGIGAGDAESLTSASQNLSASFGVPFTLSPADWRFHDGEILTFAGISLKVLETPGHTPGHVSYVLTGDPSRVFVGDTIFRGSVGRTDFPGGDFVVLARSIRDKLYTLSDSTILYPGHGPKTTVGEERRMNGFVRGAENGDGV